MDQSIFELFLGNCGWRCKNALFSLQLVESADAKSGIEGQQYLLKNKNKNLHISGFIPFKSVLCKSQL